MTVYNKLDLIISLYLDNGMKEKEKGKKEANKRMIGGKI
jgi:hypothetical protein